MHPKAPNILFIQADQMAAPVLPFYGGGVVKAPHIGRLAETGVVFERAYCNTPLCAPSRFSMMSGQYSSTIAAYDNAAEFPSAQPTFAHYLRLLGYRTVLSGKMHFVGADQLHGFEERLTSDIYPSDFGWTPNWEAPEQHQDYFHTMLSVVDAGVCERSLQIDYDDEVAFHAVRKIYDIARDDDDRPFFLLASFTHPHDPYTITKPYWDRYADSEIDLPIVPALAAEERDPHSRRLHEHCDMDRYDLDEARIRAARHAYYGAVSYVDDKVSALLQALEASGLRDDTIVIFTSDHGDMLGERGLWYKMHFYEFAARVPLVIQAPGRFAPRRVAPPVSLIDLFPTLLDFAALEATPKAALQLAEPAVGHSLLPLCLGEEPAGPHAVYGEYLGEGAVGPLVMIRRGSHKYIVGEGQPARLFDVEADPRELDDLVEKRPDLAASFAEEAARRWDFADLKAKVIADQRRRRVVFQSLMVGHHTPWDFQPRVDASRQYARNYGVLGDLERKARLPYVAAPPADGRVRRP